jgi:hypothetical protein
MTNQYRAALEEYGQIVREECASKIEDQECDQTEYRCHAIERAAAAIRALPVPDAAPAVPREPTDSVQIRMLSDALKQILGWRELRSGANEIPIERIEGIARDALSSSVALPDHTRHPWTYWQEPETGLWRIVHKITGPDGYKNSIIIGWVGKELDANAICYAMGLVAATEPKDKP